MWISNFTRSEYDNAKTIVELFKKADNAYLGMSSVELGVVHVVEERLISPVSL